MENTVKNPVILVTGAGKGIGEATVKSLVAAYSARSVQARFFLTSRTETDLKKLQSYCRSQGMECEISASDLVHSATSLASQAVKAFGRVDVLIHSAGVGRFGDFLSLTEDDLTHVMNTNVNASFILLQSVYRVMQKQKSGMIVVVTSVAAEKPFEQSAIYCMSKYAQRGLLEVIRLYGYRDGIRVLEVKPGATFTPMWGEIPGEMQAKMMIAEDIAAPITDAILLPARASVEEIVIRPLRGDL